ncbi:23200_t:CDS:2 [Dentiscutata erythropus]|uniref:23200_t:CDS:1 n=1 Tax=Dentiscutata erythropus TaxID=1348616 RepID=A0A9N9C7P4_9GLOM|nr:23200_t:CDS:2 [Dentiscutata erythropus]
MKCTSSELFQNFHPNALGKPMRDIFSKTFCDINIAPLEW